MSIFLHKNVCSYNTLLVAGIPPPPGHSVHVRFPSTLRGGFVAGVAPQRDAVTRYGHLVRLGQCPGTSALSPWPQHGPAQGNYQQVRHRATSFVFARG